MRTHGAKLTHDVGGDVGSLLDGERNGLHKGRTVVWAI